MRVTQRSGRMGSAKHNDRSFDVSKAEHIDAERTDLNFCQSWKGPLTEDGLQKAELDFYEMRYSEGLEARNQAYIREGHADRCKTAKDLYFGRLTRPEELILQIGDMNNHTNDKVFQICVSEYLRTFQEWNREHGNHGHILSVSIHRDEATIHAHVRRVWDYQKDGLVFLGQNKALELAGVELPDPERKADRYNNRKITFDAMMRERWQEICKSHGLDIETEPRVNMRHKSKADYIAGQLDAQIQQRQQALSELSEQVKSAETLVNQVEKLQSRVDELQVVDRILSKAEVGNAVKKAKTSRLDDTKVVVDKQDFEALARSAHAAEEASRQAMALSKTKRQAEAEAKRIIEKAESEANSLESKLEKSKLQVELQKYEKLEAAFPEQFRQMQQVLDSSKSRGLHR